MYQLVLFWAAGILSYALTTWGIVAAMILAHGKFLDYFLALLLMLPRPLFLITLRSARLSAVLLFLNFLGLSLFRFRYGATDGFGPTDAHFPLDAMGLLYLSPAFIIALLVLSKYKPPAAPTK